MEKIEFQREFEGQKVVDLLSSRFPLYSVHTLRQFIQGGAVWLDNKRCYPPDPLPPKGVLEIRTSLPFQDYQPYQLPSLEILFEDSEIIVLSKPAGVSSVPGRSGEANLVEALLYHFQGKIRPYIVHRLDKETSGVMVVAKSQLASRILSQAFYERKIEKEYRGFVQGIPFPEKGVIHKPLSHGKGRKKEGITEYEVLEKYGLYSLLALWPRTGRMHQIRIHLASIGHPLLVDAIYGTRKAFYLSELKRNFKVKKGTPETPLLSRLSLHSYRLVIHHPLKGEKLSFTAPLPKDLETLQKKLLKYQDSSRKD